MLTQIVTIVGVGCACNFCEAASPLRSPIILHLQEVVSHSKLTFDKICKLDPLRTLLGPQSRFGDNALEFHELIVCPQNETAVVNGLSLT